MKAEKGPIPGDNIGLVDLPYRLAPSAGLLA
jgi:hypothetical protein